MEGDSGTNKKDTGASPGTDSSTHPDSGTGYTFTTFDGPGGSPTTANGINSKGTVVGFTTANMINSNFLRTSGGTFSALDIGDPAGMANAVDTAGDVVGVANGEAFLLKSGMTPTALMPPGATSSVALGINDNGVIVGQFVNAAGVTPGFIYDGTTYTTVTPTAQSTVTNLQGVNTQGTAVGFYSEGDGGTVQHGFSYDMGSKAVTLLADPATARITSGGLALTQFLGVNDSGQAVGYYQTTNGSQYGFLYDLTSETYTFVDDSDAAPVAGVQVTQITGIDNAGEITGFFVDSSGAQHGFVGAPK
jgi:probable HAF family extracellular repeat protein